MLLNIADYGGGVIVQDSEPTGDPGMLWIDTEHEGIAKYYNGTAWVQVAPIIYISGNVPTSSQGKNGDLWIMYE